VQIFGWHGLRVSFWFILIGIIVALLVSAIIIYSKMDTEIVVPPDVKKVIEPFESLPTTEENNTISEEVVDDDAALYKVNTYFFSSACLFQYNKNIDDINDLKTQRNNVDAESPANRDEQLARIEELLSALREETADIIVRCSP